MALNWATGVDGVTLDVQIGFGSPPATPIASISWTSIAVWRVLSFNYGKSDEIDSYQAGRLSMVLSNADRRFDPLYSAGPYFGNLKPMTPVRVRLTYSATTVTLWSGYVSGWPQSYDPPRDATVNVTATDGFAVLQRTRMPSLYAAEVAADTPSLWWRLGEQSGTVAVDSSGNGQDGRYEGGATFNTRTGLVVGDDNAIAFTASQTASTTVAWPAIPFSVELWFSTTQAGAGLDYYPLLVTNPGLVWLQLKDGKIEANLVTSGGTSRRASTASTYNDGATHHVVAVWASGTTAPVLYIDGVSDTTGSSAAPGSITALGNQEVQLPSRSQPNPFIGTLDEFAIFPSALSAARVTAHYNAGTDPLEGFDTGAAITKVLDLIGWPAADRTVETGKSTVVSFDMGGMTALEVVQALEKTEQGRFFMAPDGKATFYNRHHTVTTAASTTSQATFGDSGSELLYGDLSTEYSEDKIRNSITTQRHGGSPYLTRDAASITSYREREFSVTGLYNASDDEIRDLGVWLKGHYAQPVTRVPAIVIQPRRSPTTLFPQIRDRKLVDRITAVRRPQSVGTAITLATLIEGVEHTITVDPLDWTAILTLSPAETAGIFILDDAALGVLDTSQLGF